MNKVQAIKWITKAYFFAAIAASFTHLVTAAHKGGLTGWEMWSVPFLIDGIAIIGLIMRGNEFSKNTRSIGFRVQIGAGVLSLAGNVYAAGNLGQAVYGVAIVALFVLAEWLSDNIQSADVDTKVEALNKRQVAAQKAAATRKRNARQAAKVVKAAEELIR
jgi:hypothetical protein